MENRCGNRSGPGLRNSADYIKSVEQRDSLTLGTLDHFSHFKLVGAGKQAPFRGNPKPILSDPVFLLPVTVFRTQGSHRSAGFPHLGIFNFIQLFLELLPVVGRAVDVQDPAGFRP